MEATNKKNKLIGQKLTEILKLYSDSTVMALVNDTIAIGTWPTPEIPIK